MCSPVNAYQETVKKFVAIDPLDAAARSGSYYNQNCGIFEIVYFGSLYMVERDGRVWRSDNPGEEVAFNDKTIILQYLCEASGLPPRGSWISFLELPEGAHHYVPFQTDATGPMANLFGTAPEKFARAAGVFGGRPLSMGDHSFFIPALPKIPLAVVLWEEDEEFPAKCNILFDSVSPSHLTTAALWVLGVELARKMISFIDKKLGLEKSITWLEGVKRD